MTNDAIGDAKRTDGRARLGALMLVMAVTLAVPWVVGAQEFLLKWGTPGAGDGQFSGPFGVAVDNQGDVYVVDRGNARIQKFDSTGTFLLKWGTFGTGDGQFVDPVAVAVDNRGDVYVADRVNSRIQKFDSTGTFLLKWGTGGSGDGEFGNPVAVAVNNRGDVYVAEFDNRIQKFAK